MSEPKDFQKKIKKSKKGKKKLTKDDIGEPTDFEFIRGSNRQLIEILKLAGVTKKNLQNTADRAVIDYFIELASVEDSDIITAETAPLPPISENNFRRPIKRPTEPPPPPPTGFRLSAGPLPPPPPLPPQQFTATTPLVRAAVPEQEKPAVASGIEDLLNEIKKGLNLRSIKANEKVTLKRANSNVMAQALRNALSRINDAKRDSSTDEDEDSNWEDAN